MESEEVGKLWEEENKMNIRGGKIQTYKVKNWWVKTD